MTLDEIRKSLDEKNLSEEDKDKILSLVQIKIDLERAKADTAEEVANALEAYAGELEKAVEDLSGEIKKAFGELSKKITTPHT